MVIETIKNFI